MLRHGDAVAIKAKDKVGFLLLYSFISEQMAPTQLDRMLHSRVRLFFSMNVVLLS